MSDSSIRRSIELITKFISSSHQNENIEYDKYEVREHLSWMVSTIEKTDDMPEDKICRWLGSITGILQTKYGLPEYSASRILEILKNEPFCPASHPLMIATLEIVIELAKRTAILQNLQQAPEDEMVVGTIENSAKTVLSMLALADKFTRAEPMGLKTASFELGRLQGLLKANGALDFDEERDRTRPIMHAAYKAIGKAIPATRERTA